MSFFPWRFLDQLSDNRLSTSSTQFQEFLTLINQNRGSFIGGLPFTKLRQALGEGGYSVSVKETATGYTGWTIASKDRS